MLQVPSNAGVEATAAARETDTQPGLRDEKCEWPGAGDGRRALLL